MLGPRKIGQRDLRTLQGEAGLLQGLVGRAETFGPRVEGIHCAFGFSSCWHWQLGEHFSLQPQSLHWAWAGATARISKARRRMVVFMTPQIIA